MVNLSKLFVKCRVCRVEFWSAIRCNKQHFARLDFGGNQIICPNGHKKRYNMNDFYFKETELSS
jgi:hypothetical protein